MPYLISTCQQIMFSRLIDNQKSNSCAKSSESYCSCMSATAAKIHCADVDHERRATTRQMTSVGPNEKTGSLHFGNDEYKHLIGRYIIHRPAGDPIQIKDIVYEPDKVYQMTDGQAGNAYRICFVEIKNEFSFRHFQEVIKNYGYLVPIINSGIPVTID